MTYLKRYILDSVLQDLKKKMVFIGGPRQVGKTTLSKSILDTASTGYLNWDIAHHREAILKHQLPVSSLWVFDEIHKYKPWRNYLKGVYDEFRDQKQILVTGSARLDLYRRGGDSLQGRYFYLRLYPLSIAELNIQTQQDFERLLQLGGFPEPYFSDNELDAKRWSRHYRQRLIQEDILSLENVKDLGTLEQLMIRLPECVGAPLSINALREDLQVSHKTVSSWLDIFSRLYAIFRISPFQKNLSRSVKKEKKHYHFDWSVIEDPGARFENLVAVHLLKWVHFEQDTKARDLELLYFRDVDGYEVDFIITEKGDPILAIECKFSAKDISKPLIYFKKKFPTCRAFQITAQPTKDFITKDHIRHCHAMTLLLELV